MYPTLILPFVLAAAVAQLGRAAPAGTISGVIVNASQQGAPAGGAEVVLRVQLENRFVIAAETAADEQGCFLFDGIPADESIVYLPGANHDGVHYPGPRVRLDSNTPHARVTLSVCQSVSEPNPLVLRQYEITVKPEADALRVTESMLIENPTARTYVGRPARQDARAATLRLAIPPDFHRVTFEGEFFGRQFTTFDGRLVTNVPWIPGQRNLEFTYVFPNNRQDRTWQRPLDLPCDHLRLTVHTSDPENVACTLPRAASQSADSAIFESAGGALAAGDVVRVRLKSLPVSFSWYGRWLALTLLCALIAATSWIVRLGRAI